jgi:hypothetical protein
MPSELRVVGTPDEPKHNASTCLVDIFPIEHRQEYKYHLGFENLISATKNTTLSFTAFGEVRQ